MEVQSIDRLVAQAEKMYRAANRDGAISALSLVTRMVNGHGSARELLRKIAHDCFAEAIQVRDTGDLDGAITLLVCSIELNHRSAETRAELARLLQLRPSVRDLTKECYVYPDSARGEKLYREALQTCMDFIVYNGVVGDIMEFGTLGGWTARIFAELMRDMGYLADLWLFDSFSGLPREKHHVDRESYDLRRGVWEQEMAFPDALVRELGMRVEDHIAERLATVISQGRIHIRKGYYADTLRKPISTKAALVHLDCDLYQSTREVLAALHRDGIMQDGTLLMFDDWNCNKGNPSQGQRRAFAEFIKEFGHVYEYSPFITYGFNCSSFIVHC